MILKRIILALFFISLICIVESQTELNDYFIQAQKSNKFILLYFSAEWCGPCRQMEQNVLNDQFIKKQIESNFIYLKLDIDKEIGKKVRRKYNLGGLGVPLIMIIDSAGKKLARNEGAMYKKFFVDFINPYCKSLTDNISLTSKVQRDSINNSISQLLLHDSINRGEKVTKIKQYGTRLKYGLKGGYQLSHYWINYSLLTSLHGGWHLGVIIDYEIKHNFLLKSSILISESSNLIYDEYRLNKRVTNLMIPVQFSYPIADISYFHLTCPQPFYLNIGSFFSYSINNFKNDNYTTSIFDNSLKRFDYGLRFGLSIQLGTFEPSIGYQYGLNNISNNTEKIHSGGIYFSIEVIMGK